MKIKIKFLPAPQKCQLVIRDGALSDAGNIIQALIPSQVFVLTNATLNKRHYPKLKAGLVSSGLKLAPAIVIENGERYKNLKSLKHCYDFLAEQKADRQSLLITLGGGVITDLGGVVAATYMRGIRLVHIPTTLLAQVDAAIGGKTAVNHRRAKNIIGTFYHPILVLIDPLTLATLDQRQYLNGLVEVIKIGLVASPSLFKFIESNRGRILVKRKTVLTRIIKAAVRRKLEIVRRDPTEQGFRRILNFGHTFAHALETRQGYRNLLHGEAVCLGMLVALKLSADLKLGSCETLGRVKNLLEAVKLPTKVKKPDAKALWQIMALDKKSGYGRINFMLLEKIGKPILKSVRFEQFEQAVEVLN